MHLFRPFLVLLFLATHTILNAQIWDYPYDIMGIEKEKDLRYAISYPRKVLEIDSSANGIVRTYREYDESGNMIKEAYNDRDTVYMKYDEFGYEISRIMGPEDTLFRIIERRSDTKILKIKMIRNGKNGNEIEYTYDQNGNITKVFLNSFLYENIRYDQQNRILCVESYYNNNHNLTREINYSYKADSIFYEECLYDLDTKRYPGPCDQTKGKLNANGDIEEIVMTYYNSNSGEYEANSLTYVLSYDIQGRMVKMSNTSSTGSYSYVIDYFDESGYRSKAEIIANGELANTIYWIILK